MKKVLWLAVTALVGLFAVVGLAPAAQAYPEGVCNLEVSAQVVNSGESVTGTATYSVVDTSARASAVSDTTWVMTFNGETRTGTGETFTGTFKAPAVSTPTTFKLTAVGTGDAGSCSHSVNVSVLPNGNAVTPPSHGHLPNTGGPDLWILLAGLGLVAAGTAVTVRTRQKSQPA